MTDQLFLTEIDHLENLLFAYALRLTRNYEDARDLVQETTLRAYKNRHTFREGTNFKSWVTTIMRNTYINRYRKMQKRKDVNASVDNFLYAVENKAATANGGEARMHFQELKDKLALVKEIYRVPFLMFYRGYEYREISAHLNIPVGTVKSRIYLARKRLKQLIGERPVAV